MIYLPNLSIDYMSVKWNLFYFFRDGLTRRSQYTTNGYLGTDPTEHIEAIINSISSNVFCFTVRRIIFQNGKGLSSRGSASTRERSSVS